MFAELILSFANFTFAFVEMVAAYWTGIIMTDLLWERLRKRNDKTEEQMNGRLNVFS